MVTYKDSNQKRVVILEKWVPNNRSELLWLGLSQILKHADLSAKSSC